MISVGSKLLSTMILFRLRDAVIRFEERNNVVVLGRGEDSSTKLPFLD